MVVSLIFIAFLLSNSRSWPRYTVSLAPEPRDCFLISDRSHECAPPHRSGMKKHSLGALSNVPHMELKVSHCFIPVHDHDEALAFYRDVLGLEVRNDVKSEGMGWETVGPRAQPDLNLVLEPPAANPSVSPQDKKVMSELLANGVLRGVIFATD